MNTRTPIRARNVARVVVSLLVVGAAVGLWYASGSGELDVQTQQLAPGVWHHQVRLVRGPWHVHVLEIDLPTAWAAGYRLRTANSPQGMLAKTSELGRRALAAINGDFFDDGQAGTHVLGFQIRDGCVLHPPGACSALAISSLGEPLIARFKLQAGLIRTDGVSHAIAGFNREPRRDELSLYDSCTPHPVDSVRAAFGFELQPLAAFHAINDTVPARVQQIRRRGWPLLLEKGQWLVAAGAESPADGHIAPGDTVRIFVRVIPEQRVVASSRRYVEAIGGGPRLLRDGGVAVEYVQERLSRSFAEERHPRTAAGYTRDRRVLYLLTVDGRQPGYSVGMSLKEVAVFMDTRLAAFSHSGANAFQALNLDGGGSTTMVINGQVVNSPSDQTGERPVANALLLARPSAKR